MSIINLFLKYFVFLQLVFSLNTIYSQSYCYNENINFTHLTTEEGLPQNIIIPIIQDHLGFLWFATSKELVRYDGYNMRVYKIYSNDSTKIGRLLVLFLFEDRNNNIWAGTLEDGLIKFDREKEVIKYYKLIPDNFNFKYVSCMSQDEYGFLWMGTDSGLVKFDSKNDIFKQYKIPIQKIIPDVDKAINSLVYDNDGLIWIVSGYGMERFDIKKENFTHYNFDSSDIIKNAAYKIVDSKDGYLWICCCGYIYKFNKINGVFTQFDFFDPKFKNEFFYQPGAMIEDELKNLWIATIGTGLVRFEEKTGTFSRFTYNPDNPLSISSDALLSVYQDNSGIIWIGTSSSGLNKYLKQFQEFKIIGNEFSNRPNIIWGSSIITDNDKFIWKVTSYGLQKYDIKKNIFVTYKNVPGSSIDFNINNILTLYKDKFSCIWIGTKNNGLIKFDINNNVFTNFQNNPNDSNSIKGLAISAISEDAEGNLWVGSWGDGLNKYDRKTGKFKIYYNIPGDSTSLSDNFITKLYLDKEETLWISTYSQGLSKFNPQTETFKNYYYPDKGLKNALAIYEDSKNRFWLGNGEIGLVLFDRKTGNIFPFQTGSDNNYISNILEDNTGNLWVSTAKGISKFNPETGALTNFDKNKGYNIPNILSNSACELSDGTMLFGGKEGIVCFNPDSVKINSKIPLIRITDFKIFNQSIRKYDNSPLDKEVSLADEIKLKHTDDNFSIEFAAMDYSAPLENKYEYKMEGFDNDWIYSGNKHEATYTNLDPGTYTFRVKGSNNDGVWNEEGTSIKIIITPPLWKTLWFRIFAVILIAGIFGSSIRYVTIQRYKRRLELEKERARISKDMHDEVGSSLTKIAILSQLSRQKIDNSEEVKANIEKISESASEVVDNISEIIWAINPKNDTLDNLFAYIREYASDFLELKSIDYNISLPENIPPLHLSAEFRRNIFLVIKEALNNSIKYSEASRVKILAKIKNAVMEIIISDNGKGFDISNARMFGNGLINMRKRIEDIEGEFKIESQLNNGTSVFVRVTIF